MIQKYGSYEELYSVHHYETLTRKSEDDYTIVESGIEVNEGFFKAPEYEIEQDKSVILPSEVPGTFAEATATVDPVSGEVTKLVLTNSWSWIHSRGYQSRSFYCTSTNAKSRYIISIIESTTRR